VADISDIRQAARQMRRSDASDGLATLITIALFGAAIRFHSPIQRLGGAFIGASLLYSAYQHFALRVREVPDGADASAYASLFRANLVRQRDLHRGWRLWSRLAMMFAGFVLLYVGRIPAAPGSAQRIALTLAFAAAPAFIVQSIRQKAHKYQRQIDELDALPKGL